MTYEIWYQSRHLVLEETLSRAAAATHGTATAMEQAALDAALVGECHNFLLGFIQVPRGRQNAAVFA